VTFAWGYEQEWEAFTSDSLKRAEAYYDKALSLWHEDICLEDLDVDSEQALIMRPTLLVEEINAFGNVVHYEHGLGD